MRRLFDFVACALVVSSMPACRDSSSVASELLPRASDPPARVTDAGATESGGAVDASAPAQRELASECADPPAAAFDVASLPACADCAGGAHCVPTALFSAQDQAPIAQLAACDDTSLCVPDAFIANLGFVRPASCRSWDDVEGRCLSSCLPAVATQRDTLPQATCAPHERCVPCFEPMTGAATGACSLSCDPGPREAAPSGSGACCSGNGSCVPHDLLPPAQRDLLARETCGVDALCAPTSLIHADAPPEPCTSIAEAEGRCLSTCLPSVTEQAETLPRDVCSADERCVPCIDPLSGEETGACRLHGDAPRSDPVLFDTPCCGEQGLCIPGELAGANASILPRDRCVSERGEGWLCAPENLVSDPQQSEPFASCRVRLSFFEMGHGKCVPRCMVSERRWVESLLARESCERDEVCVPCSIAGDLPGC